VKYPPAPKTDQIDILHGVPVPDPFRRLEDADDPETVAWVAAENDLCRRLLDSPQRARITTRLRELHHVSRMSVPAVRGDRIFFTETDGTRGQAILCLARGEDQAGGSHAFTPSVLVDPNLLDADATTAITVFEPDAAGARVAYGLSRNGSDVQQLLIHDVASGSTLDDRLDWVKFASIAWHGGGFFYTRYPEPGTVPA
jgi:prolyl oligopeptidase